MRLDEASVVWNIRFGDVRVLGGKATQELVDEGLVLWILLSWEDAMVVAADNGDTNSIPIAERLIDATGGNRSSIDI